MSLLDRIDYDSNVLDEQFLLADPIEQFHRWFADAESAGVAEPNAMTLATVDAAGTPDARMVLLRGAEAAGFSFFTNYASAKSRQLEATPRAALVFYWHALHRQVRVRGAVARLAAEESDAYFATRPRLSQLSAWASRQSEPIGARAHLEQALTGASARFESADVPRPPFWGGFRLVPDQIEFWQGRIARLHDRLVYSRSEDGAWLRRRLNP